jgi:hypothetical protein
MNAPFFERLEQVLRYQGPGAGFDLLIREALERKDFPLYFEVRLMQKRHELGLPLLDPGTISSRLRKKADSGVTAEQEASSMFYARRRPTTKWSVQLHLSGAAGPAEPPAEATPQDGG